jgi:hypothetical protein
MPTIRHPVRPAEQSPITPEAIAIWRELQRCRSDDRRRELELRLHDVLRLPPWILSPKEVDEQDPPRAGDDTVGATTWSQALALRKALQSRLT